MKLELNLGIGFRNAGRLESGTEMCGKNLGQRGTERAMEKFGKRNGKRWKRGREGPEIEKGTGKSLEEQAEF